MNRLICYAVVLATLLAAGFIPATRAQSLAQIGVTLLRSQTTNVDGSGIRVAQPEAGYDASEQYTNWEVNPGAVGRSVGVLTYISANGLTTNFPNSLSSESGHADTVGGYFYGMSVGVATNVAHVDNFDANYFVQLEYYMTGSITNWVCQLSGADPTDLVVNQSFTWGSVPNPISVVMQQAIDSAYDNYTATNHTLFISAVNNGGSVSPPGTAYNSIGVAAYGPNAQTSIGPTLDNGRCKPDITAPAGMTSFSTPQVSGAAAVLMQAALRGDGGSDTSSASDLRTIKALLLNGAVKPADWTNSNFSPLDARYGAGVLNVYNSYKQLAGGKHGYSESTTVATGDAHPPNGATGTVGVLSGWDFNTNTSGKFPSQFDAVNHYYFNITNILGDAKFTATATLVWNRHQSKTNINNLNLFLYNCATSNPVTCSTSLVDNVEHIFVPQLAQGRYDLQVWKAGGIDIVSAAESYALAFAFNAPLITATGAGTNLQLSWPAYPAGFGVESTTNSAVPTWNTNNLPAPTLTGSTNILSLPMTNAAQFFRLRQPNF